MPVQAASFRCALVQMPLILACYVSAETGYCDYKLVSHTPCPFDLCATYAPDPPSYPQAAPFREFVIIFLHACI